MKDTIAALFKQCGLGEITEDIRPVSGGLMHKMYKVHATSGASGIGHAGREPVADCGIVLRNGTVYVKNRQKQKKINRKDCRGPMVFLVVIGTFFW